MSEDHRNEHARKWMVSIIGSLAAVLAGGVVSYAIVGRTGTKPDAGRADDCSVCSLR